jgi:hypothetical protein
LLEQITPEISGKKRHSEINKQYNEFENKKFAQERRNSNLPGLSSSGIDSGGNSASFNAGSFAVN